MVAKYSLKINQLGHATQLGKESKKKVELVVENQKNLDSLPPTTSVAAENVPGAAASTRDESAYISGYSGAVAVRNFRFACAAAIYL